MNVKNVVKVMNFHSLLRVDKARKDAEKYFVVEKQLREMIASITNNRNYVLDKKVLSADSSKPVLNIYIGSDLGFCGGYNFNANDAAKKDTGSDKVLIGKKMWKSMTNVKLQINKNDYLIDRSPVTDFIYNAIVKRDYSEINIKYNHYVNSSTINWETKRLYPLDFNDEEFENMKFTEDFVCESDIDDLLVNMISTYVDYEVLITMKNSLASENIMRQNSTTDSLKKIDELEEEKAYVAYKEMKAKVSQKTIENYVKLRYSGDKA